MFTFGYSFHHPEEFTAGGEISMTVVRKVKFSRASRRVFSLTGR